MSDERYEALEARVRALEGRGTPPSLLEAVYHGYDTPVKMLDALRAAVERAEEEPGRGDPLLLVARDQIARAEKAEADVARLRRRIAAAIEEAESCADGAPDATGAQKACGRIAAILAGERVNP